MKSFVYPPRKAADAEAALLQTRVDDDSMVGGARGRKEQEEVEEMEADDEEESEETLKKEREWDDFKDGKTCSHSEQVWIP